MALVNDATSQMESSFESQYSCWRRIFDHRLAALDKRYTQDNLDIDHAKKILDQEHFGLKEIKERILDFISIKKLNEEGITIIQVTHSEENAKYGKRIVRVVA